MCFAVVLFSGVPSTESFNRFAQILGNVEVANITASYAYVCVATLWLLLVTNADACRFAALGIMFPVSTTTLISSVSVAYSYFNA